ncbi:MAG: hypothetical protein R3F29_11925 [Planctomycetota bacterium]
MKTFKTIAFALITLLSLTSIASAQRQDPRPRPDAPRAQRQGGDRAGRMQQFSEGMKERIRQLVREEVARAMKSGQQQGRRGQGGRGQRGRRQHQQEPRQRGGALRQRLQQLPQQLQQRLREAARGRLQERARSGGRGEERRPAGRGGERRGKRKQV